MFSKRRDCNVYAMLFVAGISISMVGCKRHRVATGPVPSSASGPQPGAVQIVANGAISGTILFTGPVPAATIDTSMDPACAAGGKLQLPTEQFIVKNHKLANVYVYIKSGPPAAMRDSGRSAQAVVIDQKDCQFRPHVVAVAAGGYVEFRNSDGTMHNVHTNPNEIDNESIDVSQGPHGAPQMKQFAKPEVMIPVRCNVHPWMNAFVNVSATRFFDISNADGHFDLHGMPPGDYVIAAVHEKLGEKTMNVTVTSHQNSTAEFTFAK